MKNVSKNYIIIGLVAFILVLIGIIIGLWSRPNFSFSHVADKGLIEEKNEQGSNSDLEDTNQNSSSSQNTSISESNKDSSQENLQDQNSSIINPSSNSNSSEETFQNEQEVVSYFEEESSQFSTYTNQENLTFREKAKNGFITVIDFIFYGKEIKGYTFSGLTNSAKLQVIKIALTIDHKIDQYFPNYKDTIKDKYNNLKGKLAVLYLELTSSLCDTVGTDTCNQAKADFQNMKESFGFTWSLIKELATSGKNKVKDFYENEFRNS